MVKVEVCPVGGYDEVGRNCTAVKIDDTVVILDLGLNMQEYIVCQEAGLEYNFNKYVKRNVIPDPRQLGDWKDKVALIVISHGHLDHVGAAPMLASEFPGVPIIGTPYTMEILKALSEDKDIDLSKRIKMLNKNQKFKVNDKIVIEFINVTHSIPQTVMICVHTPEGKILYALDFKFDLFPVIGKKTNPERLKGLDNVHTLIVEALYARERKKMPSESIAKLMLRDVMMGPGVEGRALFVTTFASHIARHTEILAFAEKLGREVIFLGRSMAKYIGAAERVGLIDFSSRAEICQFTKQIKKALRKVEQNPEKYVVVCTGHQGEKDAILARLARNELEFPFEQDDVLIFSAPVIPTPPTIKNRKDLEAQLRKRKIRIFRDVHVSGHGAGEDLKDLLLMVKPKHVIPAHGDITFREELAEISEDLGYKIGKTCHLLNNGEKTVLK